MTEPCARTEDREERMAARHTSHTKLHVAKGRTENQQRCDSVFSKPWHGGKGRLVLIHRDRTTKHNVDIAES